MTEPYTDQGNGRNSWPARTCDKNEKGGAMAGSKPGKTKSPRSIRDLMTIEDQLEAIRSAYSTIRKEMADLSAETVDLNIGTLVHFLGKLQPISQKHLGDWRKQRATMSAAAIRDRLIREASEQAPGKAAAGPDKIR